MFLSTFWSHVWLRRNRRPGQRVVRVELADTQPLPPLPVQPPYTQQRGRYRPRRRGFNTRGWDCNPGARRRVGPGVDSGVAL